MRIAVAVLCSVIVAAAASAGSLQVFEFKGIRAGEVVPQSKVKNCDKDDPQLCFVKVDDDVAGVRSLVLDVTLYRGRLSSVTIWADAIAFGTITDALRAKYGRPCAAVTETWRSRIGRPVPNPTYTWCFASGKLKARMHGAQIDVSEFEYRDINAAPDVHPKPKVDF